ncbi:AAA family ATPase [Lentisphaerota bacterium WC36G]|nr:AAA family ATPase [Lentisphaerae bacterium WC36]
MFIEKIVITNFGIFKDLTIENLSVSQINLVCENNEFGKTTLFEFIRRVLYGFAGNDYGENCEGKIVLNINDQLLTIERTKRSVKKDNLTVYYQEKVVKNNEAEDFLKNILPVNSKIFQDVYAFSLEELQQIGLLDDEDIKIKIFGAGQGISANINNSVKLLADKSDSLYKWRGSNQIISQQLNELDMLENEIKAASINVDEYDQKSDELSKIDNNIQEQKKQLDKLRNQLQNLERQSKVVELITELKHKKSDEKILIESYQQQLSKKMIAQHDINKLEDLLISKNDYQLNLRNVQIDIKNLEQKLTKQQAENKLLEGLNIVNLNDDLKFLENQLTILSSNQKQIFAADYEFRTQMKSLSDKCRNIDKSLTLAKLREISSDQKMLDCYHNISNNFTVAEKNLNNKQNYLDVLESENISQINRQIESEAKKISLNRYQALLGITIVGYLICTVLIYSVKFLWLGIAAGFASSIILMFIVKPFNKLLKEVFVEKKIMELRDELKIAQRDFEIVSLEWENFTAEIFHSTSYTVNDFETKVLLPLIGAKDQLNKLLQKRGEVNLQKRSFMKQKKSYFALLMRHFLVNQKFLDIENYKELNLIANCNCDIIDSEVYLKKLHNFYNSIKQNFEINKELMIHIEQYNTEREKLISAKQICDEKIVKLLNYFTVENIDELKSVFAIQQKNEQLTDNIKQLAMQVKINLDIDCSIDELLENYGNINRQEIEENLFKIKEQLTLLHQSYDENIKKQALLKKDLDQYANDDDIKKIAVVREQLKSNMKKNICDWLAKKLAQNAIEESLNKFQQKNQPFVINNAAKYFYELVGDGQRIIQRNFTDKKLLIKPSQTANEKFVLSDNMIDVTQLSRGAKEQLFLAIRLALIEKYCADGFKMPLIMDDVLVNFDNKRCSNALKVLARFAYENEVQLIFMSCNEKMISYFEKELAKLNSEDNKYLLNQLKVV